MAEWEPLLWLLMFLVGWFVCWIQMAQSESRKVQRLQSVNQSLLKALRTRQQSESPLSQSKYLTQLQLENQKLRSENQKLQFQNQPQELKFQTQQLLSRSQSQFPTERSQSQDWDLQQG